VETTTPAVLGAVAREKVALEVYLPGMVIAGLLFSESAPQQQETQDCTQVGFLREDLSNILGKWGGGMKVSVRSTPELQKIHYKSPPFNAACLR
jgi:hypothetical protein